MDILEQVLNMNWVGWVLGLFLLLSAAVFIGSIISKFADMIGKPIGALRQRKLDHEMTIANAEAIRELSKKHEEDTKNSIKHDELIRKDLANLTHMFVEKQIDDMRFEILDFASAISLGRQYSKEQFDHVITIDKKYQKILAENGLENGQVTASMEVIMEIYKEKLKNGF